MASKSQMITFALASAFSVATATYSSLALHGFQTNLLGNDDKKYADTLALFQWINCGFGGVALLLSLYVLWGLMRDGFVTLNIPIISSLSPSTANAIQWAGFLFTLVITVLTLMFLHKQKDNYQNNGKMQVWNTATILNYVMCGFMGISIIATLMGGNA